MRSVGLGSGLTTRRNQTGRKNMRFEKRVRALEKRFLVDPVVLYFADGSTRQISGRGDFLLTLLADTCRGADLSPRQAEALELIRRSVGATEPGGARMVELLRLWSNRPQAPDEDDAIV
jgi:hypothetical protein